MSKIGPVVERRANLPITYNAPSFSLGQTAPAELKRSQASEQVTMRCGISATGVVVNDGKVLMAHQRIR